MAGFCYHSTNKSGSRGSLTTNTIVACALIALVPLTILGILADSLTTILAFSILMRSVAFTFIALILLLVLHAYWKHHGNEFDDKLAQATQDEALKKWIDEHSDESSS